LRGQKCFNEFFVKLFYNLYKGSILYNIHSGGFDESNPYIIPFRDLINKIIMKFKGGFDESNPYR
jgi:hypothetical protein